MSIWRLLERAALIRARAAMKAELDERAHTIAFLMREGHAALAEGIAREAHRGIRADGKLPIVRQS